MYVIIFPERRDANRPFMTDHQGHLLEFVTFPWMSHFAAGQERWVSLRVLPYQEIERQRHREREKILFGIWCCCRGQVVTAQTMKQWVTYTRSMKAWGGQQSWSRWRFVCGWWMHMMVFQWHGFNSRCFPVHTCADSWAPISPTCVQPAPVLLCKKPHVHLSLREAWWLVTSVNTCRKHVKSGRI